MLTPRVGVSLPAGISEGLEIEQHRAACPKVDDWRGAIVWFVLAFLFLLAIPVVFQFPIWVFGLVVLVAAILAGVYLLVRWLFTRGSPEFSARWSYLTCFAALLLGLTALTALPVYYAAYMVQLRRQRCRLPSLPMAARPSSSRACSTSAPKSSINRSSSILSRRWLMGIRCSTEA